MVTMLIITVCLISLFFVMYQNHFLIPVLGGSTDFFAGRMIDNKSLETLAQEHWQWAMSDVPAEVPVDRDQYG